ncbi:uncharacterized protein PITG_21559 [Phytophthora infestans T30-4]|uniref:Uncharacterized protein n=1 Tax=Phytophthora infestans (strain T30-4) TaxID=403677 RepID=D0P441_PHYIT|nr:uncharacterized protein PITG_21559 [Phytophthora infestans T30-4]EEY62921.1 conserved hypothetical protein [Phytophthora infestans T30-4]|eukprot:XP_002894932.1 conserved hypothetical protein [Phytophthora infestans T30-4]
MIRLELACILFDLVTGDIESSTTTCVASLDCLIIGSWMKMNNRSATFELIGGKSALFVIDLNQGSYQNGVIAIDATAQLNGSEGFASLRDAYIMLPYNVSMRNGDTAHTAAANRFCATLKCGNWNVIDSMSLELNAGLAKSARLLDPTYQQRPDTD